MMDTDRMESQPLDDGYKILMYKKTHTLMLTTFSTIHNVKLMFKYLKNVNETRRQS